jgi:hypothetical protein
MESDLRRREGQLAGPQNTNISTKKGHRAVQSASSAAAMAANVAGGRENVRKGGLWELAPPAPSATLLGIVSKQQVRMMGVFKETGERQPAKTAKIIRKKGYRVVQHRYRAVHSAPANKQSERVLGVHAGVGVHACVDVNAPKLGVDVNAGLPHEAPRKSIEQAHSSTGSTAVRNTAPPSKVRNITAPSTGANCSATSYPIQHVQRPARSQNKDRPAVRKDRSWMDPKPPPSSRPSVRVHRQRLKRKMRAKGQQRRQTACQAQHLQETRDEKRAAKGEKDERGEGGRAERRPQNLQPRAGAVRSPHAGSDALSPYPEIPKALWNVDQAVMAVVISGEQKQQWRRQRKQNSDANHSVASTGG